LGDGTVALILDVSGLASREQRTPMPASHPQEVFA
jgi:chemotaxis protein histidine kinase CheA